MTFEGRIKQYRNGTVTIMWEGLDKQGALFTYVAKDAAEDAMFFEAINTKQNVLFEVDRSGTLSGIRSA